MSFFSVQLVLLAVLVFPPVQRAFFSLEWGENRGENIFRWSQFVFVLLIFGLSFDNFWQNASVITRISLQFIVIICYLELALRLFARYALPRMGRKSPLLAKIYQYITENPDNLYYSRYVPHPFLQFTGPRNVVPDSEDDYFLGFKDIKRSDLIKPDGVIRIACLGGSTTADGYPEQLETFLNENQKKHQFQVLNFGIMWWSSVHSTVNYVLNVVDFKPDYVVLHDSCNDHHYRGFPGLRGDCAHAYRLFLVPQTTGETLFRFSLIYRVVRIILTWLFPSRFRPHFEMKDIGLVAGKTYHYDPAELYIIERNIETVCTLAPARGSKICLTTMPLSGTRKFSEEHDRVYRPHTNDVNMIIRDRARRHNCLLADFDLLMSGKEHFFNDAVHSSIEGNQMKAETVGKEILADLQT